MASPLPEHPQQPGGDSSWADAVVSEIGEEVRRGVGDINTGVQSPSFDYEGVGGDPDLMGGLFGDEADPGAPDVTAGSVAAGATGH